MYHDSLNKSFLFAHRAALLGCLYFALLLVLATVFYKERCTYMDVSFQTFEMIRSGWPATQVYRFGSVMTQIFPLLFIWMKAPLWMVGLAYSLGVVMYQFLIFLYLAFVLRSERWAMVYLLCQAMMTAHMFFWIQSEFSQSVPWIILTLARIDLKMPAKNGLLAYWPDALILITLVFFHPLSFPVFLLGAFILWMASKGRQQTMKLVLSASFCALIYTVKRLGFDNWYDHGAHERTENLFRLFPHYFHTESTLQFLHHSHSLYVGFWLSLGMLLLWLLYRRLWLKTIVAVWILAAYFFFINTTHPKADDFYLENFYLALPLLLAMMLVLWPNTSGKKEGLTGLFVLGGCLIVLTGVRLIRLDAEYVDRLNLYRELVAAHHGKKVILEERQVDMKRLKMSWPSAYEIWMLTQMEQGSTASLLITDDAGKYRDYVPQRQSFFGIQIYPYAQLPSPYFRFVDSTSQYEIQP